MVFIEREKGERKKVIASRNLMQPSHLPLLLKYCSPLGGSSTVMDQ